jgi:hypothetical protein
MMKRSERMLRLRVWATANGGQLGVEIERDGNSNIFEVCDLDRMTIAVGSSISIVEQLRSLILQSSYDIVHISLNAPPPAGDDIEVLTLYAAGERGSVPLPRRRDNSGNLPGGFRFDQISRRS